MAQRTRVEQEAALNPPAPAAATVATAPPRAASPAPARSNAGIQPPQQSVQATALVSQQKATADQPAFYQRWLGSLSGLTASATGATETTGTPANLPTPPRR
jgi:hypothetical protein